MRFLLKLVTVLAIAMSASFYVWFSRTQRPDLSRSVIALSAEEAAPQKARPVYPKSVVPGGVASGQEVKDAIAADPVVAKHYSGVDPGKLQPGQLTRDVTAYVSYREKDKTYWTLRKVRLRRGEILLGDGQNWIRARCGNLISFVPQRPFLPPEGEPTEVDFDTPYPEVPVELAALRVPDLSRPLPGFHESEVAHHKPPETPKPEHVASLRWPMPLVPLPARPLSRSGLLPPGEQTDVPEPGSVVLFATGLSVLAGFVVLRRRKR